MQYKHYNFKSFNLYTIKTDKFKNCHLEIIFRNKIEKNELMNRRFLIELMAFSTRKYNNQKKLSIYLEELYNTSFYSLISRVGGAIFTNFCFDFLDPKYAQKGFLEEILDFVKEVIYNPDINENTFNIDNFNIIKNNIIYEIKTFKENIKAYAYKRLFENMDKESFLSYDMVGKIDDALGVTPQSVVKAYNTMINNDYCDIYLIGNLNMDKIAKYFDDNFVSRTIKTYDIPLITSNKSNNRVKVVKETDDITQANLLVGCNIESLSIEQKDIIGYVYNYLLGGGLDSKLGKNLRQQNSLCYTVNSIYQKYDSVIVIYAGIDNHNYDKCVKLIKKALKEMSNNISEEELNNAKKNIITSLNMINDNPSSIINNYLFQNIANLKNIKDRINNVKEISVSDIQMFAKKVKINTIYMLSGVN